MSLLVGGLLFFADRSFKYVFYSGAVINRSYIAGTEFLLIISIITFVLLINTIKIGGSRLYATFIISGGVSNIIDIIIFGGVIDYIDLMKFKLNFSDILITIGIILLIAKIWVKKK